jgi:hypothetical protein
VKAIRTDVTFPLENSQQLDDISKFYMANKMIPTPCRYQLTPQSGLKDTYIDITEEALVETLATDDETKKWLQTIYGMPNDKQHTKKDVRNAALLQKGLLISKLLFRLTEDETDEVRKKYKHGYHATVGLARSLSAQKRYFLDGTFRTNGQTLQLMAIDISKRKPTDKEASDDTFAHTSQGQGGVDRLLKSVEQAFPNHDSVTNVFGNPEETTVIGIDLGERFTAAACAINFSSDNP